jgi:hypothetical protein
MINCIVDLTKESFQFFFLTWAGITMSWINEEYVVLISFYYGIIKFFGFPTGIILLATSIASNYTIR